MGERKQEWLKEYEETSSLFDVDSKFDSQSYHSTSLQ